MRSLKISLLTVFISLLASFICEGFNGHIFFRTRRLYGKLKLWDGEASGSRRVQDSIRKHVNFAREVEDVEIPIVLKRGAGAALNSKVVTLIFSS